MYQPPYTVEEREFLQDVFDTALNCGIRYWAKYQRKTPYHSLLVSREDPGELLTLDLKAIARGVAWVMSPAGTKGLNSELWGTIAHSIVARESYNIDAEGADVIVQAALFGEVIYG